MSNLTKDGTYDATHYPVDPGFDGWSEYLWETFPESVATCDAYEPTGCGTPEDKCDHALTKTTFDCDSFPQPIGVQKDCTG